MNKYIYSAKSNAFYPSELKSEYELAGTWPDDGVFILNTVFDEFSTSAPDGFMRGTGDDGLPCWVKVPEPTKEELIVIANYEKSNLLVLAHQTISIWQTELQLGSITDADKAQLINWLAYIKKLNSVDTSTIPNIYWPESPTS